MRPGFENVIQVIQLLFPLIRLEDSELDDWLHASTVEPYVILPWIITWFAHHLNTFSDVTRLYDAFLVSHPLFPLYCSAAVRSKMVLILFLYDLNSSLSCIKNLLWNKNVILEWYINTFHL